MNSNEYLTIIYNNFIDIYDKYQSLKVYCNDSIFNKKRNKWYLKKISEIKEEYFNNCVFIVYNIEDIEPIISLLYNNNYLNFKTTLIINKIKDDKMKKIIFEDEKINYNLCYTRAIILKKQFILQLLKLNINIYVYSMENQKKLKNILFQGINDYKNKNIFLEKKRLTVDYSNFNNINKIISNFKNNNNIINNKNNSPSIMNINKQNISFKEINDCLKEFQYINAETIIFSNILIENSFLNSFFGKFKFNNSINYYNKYIKI